MWNVRLPEGKTPAIELARKWLKKYGPAPTEPGRGEIVLSADDETLGSQGYRLNVMKLPNGQRITIEAGTEAGMLYGLSDFLFEVLPQERQAHTWMSPYYFRNPFKDGFSMWKNEVRPRIAHRGLWTWGHVIYDYKGYLEHMAQLKLNEIVIWNDFAPLNAAEVVAYAHALGISVFWGYSWGWDCGHLPDLGNADVFEKVMERVVSVYRKDYASLPGDGIYFQTATETPLEELDGVPIAESAVRLVNEASKRLWEINPELNLLFGLHATSVQSHLDAIQTVDPRVRIVWEDGGAFPYAYLPENLSARTKTLDFTRSIVKLRKRGTVGAVTKGLICLDWTDFQHRTQPERIGEADEARIAQRMREVLPVMKMIQSYWLKNGGELFKHARVFASAKDSQVLGLMEDGLFSRRVWFPTAMFADCLWNPERSFETRRGVVARRPDVSFANLPAEEDRA